MPEQIPFYRRLSISNKLAFWYGTSLFVMLSIFAFFLYQSFHQAIHHNYDRHLRFEAEQLLPYIKEQKDRLVIDLSEYSRNEALQRQGSYGTYVRLFYPDGQLIYKSPNYEGARPLPARLPGHGQEEAVSRTWQDMPARTLYYPLKSDGQLDGWLELTGFEWTLHEEVTRLGQYLIFIILASVLFSILGGYLLSRRALSPISALIQSARAIKTHEFGRRLPVNYAVEDELTELAETFNTMLDRLQSGYEREKRFTSDAAHELLNPLTSLRNEAEIMLRRPRTEEEYQQTLNRMLHEIQRMSRMVNLLLQLSRVESKQQIRTQTIEAGNILKTVIEEHRPSIRDKSIDLETAIDADIAIQGTAVHLEEIFTNLLGNAIKYSREHGHIAVRLQKDPPVIRLTVKDDGAGFDPETRERLFERFYRSSQHSVQDQPGSGLGLPLVKAIVDVYEGSITARSEGPGKGSEFIMELPLDRKHSGKL